MRTAAFLSGLTALFAHAPALAEDYICSGDAPSWDLAFDEVQATFEFPAPTDMDVMNEVPAEGTGWPKAFTLIGDRDTAIVLLERETCGAAPYRAHVLTQRGQSPILLTGCCTDAR